MTGTPPTLWPLTCLLPSTNLKFCILHTLSMNKSSTKSKGIFLRHPLVFWTPWIYWMMTTSTFCHGLIHNYCNCKWRRNDNKLCLWDPLLLRHHALASNSLITKLPSRHLNLPDLLTNATSSLLVEELPTDALDLSSIILILDLKFVS